MSIEEFKDQESPFSQEDLDTAKKMVEEDEVLSKDERANEIVANGGRL